MNKITYLCFALLLCTIPLSFAQTDEENSSSTDNIQRVRIDFKTPQGYIRHLLLAFTPDNSASDGVDYGYDARNVDNIPDDLNWIIDSQRFVIQGVGQFDNTKLYPFGMFMTNTGPIEIALTALENFDAPIDVFVYDAQEDTFSPINDSCYAYSIETGVYHNRFYIAFLDTNDVALSNEDNSLEQVSINYLNQTRTLKIDSKGTPFQLKLFNLQGQLINSHYLSASDSNYGFSMDYIQSQVILAVLESENQTVYKRVIIN